MDTISQDKDLIAKWRNDGSSGNPAGPLFSSGEFAEADIASESGLMFTQCGTNCTYSLKAFCC
ncbi:DUF6229 family protein [Metallibacterium scheffleri]|uniref:DUF6229 family protein n=1 Tax=Metallibacterium scheffleri TaxID=993689 RepID=UPI003CCDE513